MSAPTYDPAAFHHFEHEGWERLSEGYHRHWETVTTQAIPSLLAAAGIAAGTSLLDVACGPGYASGAAAARGAEAVGIDFSANMVSLAESIFPDVDFRVADAEDLPFSDGSFDVVLINFGILHFPNPESALAQAHRVLKPDGTLAFTAWAEAEESAIAIAMGAIAEKGSLRVDLPPGTPLYRFGDPDECRAVLDEIGFADVTSTRLELSWRLPRPDVLMETFSQATARMSGLLKAQDPAALPGISAAMAARCAAYDQGGATVLPMPAVLTVANKD